MEKEILDSYRDTKNPGSYSGLFNFYKTNKFYNKAKIAKVLKRTRGYRLHFPAYRKIPRRFVYAPSIHDQFGIDLIDIQKYAKSNFGKRYILVVLDFFSKMAWLEAVKKKTTVEVRDALEKVLTRANIKPSVIQSDDGKEFVGGAMKKWCSDNNIKQFSTSSPIKVSYVERFIRTIFGRISRYMTEHKTKRFVHKLMDFEKAYQNSYHRSIGRTPSSVNRENESEVWDKLYGKKIKKQLKSYFKVGDKVNVKLTKSAFAKGYTPNFEDTEYEIAFVHSTRPTTYQVKRVGGDIIPRKYYRQELVSTGS